jgi:hypothetical protein
VGKSSLAERIMLRALQDDWEVVAAPAGDLEALWDLAEPGTRRLIYLDDFLGEAVLRHDAADAARTLDSLIPYIRRHSDRLRLLMTARDQVLAQAAEAGGDRLRKLAALPFRCEIDLAELDEATRIAILLSHVQHADLPVEVGSELADDNRLRTLAAHPSFNPRLIRTALIDNPLPQHTAEDVLRRLAEAFAEPARLWQASFDALDPSAQQILLALATFPSGALAYQDLIEVSATGAQALHRLRSFRTLESAWVRMSGPPTGRYVSFAHPGCRDFLLGMLEQGEGALVHDIIGGGLRRLEQVVALSQAAGLLAATGTPQLTGSASHLVLYGVLAAHRGLLASRLEGLWLEAKARAEGAAGTRVLRLRDAAALVVCYGGEHDAGWVEREAESLLRDAACGSGVPPAPAFALARGLLALARRASERGDVSDTAHRWVALALENSCGLHDLDAYEDLPDALRTPESRRIAARRAAVIVEEESDRLRHEGGSVADRQAAAHELAVRAEWYGVELDVADLVGMDEEPSDMGSAA